MLLLASVVCALGWHGVPGVQPRVQPVRLRSSVLAAVNEKGGFGQTPKPKSKAPPPVQESAQVSMPAAPPRGEGGIDAVLASRGVYAQPSRKELRKAAYREPDMPSLVAPPVAPGPLAGVPMEIQNQMEQIFITLCGLALTFFIVCGFSTIEDAYLTVTKSEPPTFLAPVLPVLAKSFTPSLGVVLVCSILLGVFKQAQFADPGQNLIYKEDDQ